jgi:hypothetical protein
MTLAPCLAAATAAEKPAIPPPATSTSTGSSSVSVRVKV